jgi:hypothetical protein
VCAAAPGCGPWVRIERLFRGGTRYVATGYARATADGIRVKMVLGSSGTDVQTGEAVRLDDEWSRLSVRWTPPADVTDAELGFQVSDPRATTLDVDSVLLPTQGAVPSIELPRPLDPDEELRALDAGRFVTVSPGRIVSEGERVPLDWALLGLGAGLLVALAGIAGAVAARRRRGGEHEAG